MPAEASSKKKWIWTLIRVSIGLALLCYMFRPSELRKMSETFANLKGWTVVAAFIQATLIFALCQFIVAFRWWLVLRTQHIHITFWTSVRLDFLGLFYNNFLLGSVGGDAVRAWYVTRYTHRRFEAALSVLVDRVVGLISMCIMAILAWWVFFQGERLKIGQGFVVRGFAKLAQYKSLGVWIALAVIVAAILISAIPAGRRAMGAAVRAMLNRVMPLVRRVGDAIVLYCRSPLTLAAAVLITIASQALVVYGFWLIGQSMGIGGTLGHYMVFFPLSWVLGAIPISPAGLGVVEGYLSALFVYNLPGAVIAPQASALAGCQRVIWWLVSLPGLVLHLRGSGEPRDFSVDYEKSIN